MKVAPNKRIMLKKQWLPWLPYDVSQSPKHGKTL